MSKLEELTPNASVRGILPDSLATVVNVHWHGSAALELTYKGPDGKVANELLYRHDEPRIEVVERGRPWSFDGVPAGFRGRAYPSCASVRDTGVPRPIAAGKARRSGCSATPPHGKAWWSPIMADATPSVPSLGERLKDIRLIEQALARAVRAALLRHKQAGNPVAVWREGRIVWLEPKDIPTGD